MMQNLKRNSLVVSKLTWGIWQILTWALKIFKKICTVMGSFYPKKKIHELKIYRGIMCHDNEEWCKISKRNWLVVSKLIRGIWLILTWAPKRLKDLHFNGLFFIKVYNLWAKTVQRSYVWWHWRLIQNLKENWLVLSKIARGIWQIFTGWKVAISFWKVKWRN